MAELNCGEIIIGNLKLEIGRLEKPLERIKELVTRNTCSGIVPKDEDSLLIALIRRELYGVLG